MFTSHCVTATAVLTLTTVTVESLYAQSRAKVAPQAGMSLLINSVFIYIYMLYRTIVYMHGHCLCLPCLSFGRAFLTFACNWMGDCVCILKANRQAIDHICICFPIFFLFLSLFCYLSFSLTQLCAFLLPYVPCGVLGDNIPLVCVACCAG